MAANFDSVPILDHNLIRDGHKDMFILKLRNAAINVGFLYLKNPPVDREVLDGLLEYVPKLFDIPQEKKDAIAMINSPHFLGYSKLGNEFTKGATDQREQFDFATEHECQWKPGEPEYKRMWGNAQVMLCISSS